jgi:hypothetical protein
MLLLIGDGGMKTKYDWTYVPSETKFIATDEDGNAHGWTGEPVTYLEDSNWNSNEFMITTYWIPAKNNNYSEDWKDSLEERPK